MSKSRQGSSKSGRAAYVAQLAQTLPSRPKDAVAYICEAYFTWQQQHGDDVENYAEYMGFYALLNMYLTNLDLHVDAPELTGDKHRDMQSINAFYANVRRQLAQMTLDLSLLSNLSQSSLVNDAIRFYKLTAIDKSAVLTLGEQLRQWLDTSIVNNNSQQNFSDKYSAILNEKYAIMREQLEHDVLDLDLAWRFISQFGVTLDALELDKNIPSHLLQQISAELCRIQARAEKLPESSLKIILMKLTNPTRWEQESVNSRNED